MEFVTEEDSTVGTGYIHHRKGVDLRGTWIPQDVNFVCGDLIYDRGGNLEVNTSTDVGGDYVKTNSKDDRTDMEGQDMENGSRRDPTDVGGDYVKDDPAWDTKHIEG